MSKVFFSPSIKRLYKYPNGGDERFWMNAVVDEMLPYLKRYDIDYRRIPQNMGKLPAIDLANQGSYKLFMALGTSHGATGQEGSCKGVTVSYYGDSSLGQQAAEQMYLTLQRLYPQPELVQLKAEALPELVLTAAAAVSLKLGYHDNPQDEIWLTGRLKEIGAGLAAGLDTLFKKEEWRG